MTYPCVLVPVLSAAIIADGNYRIEWQSVYALNIAETFYIQK